MIEWAIIGGGIHGCTAATFLIKSGKTSIDRLRIIDLYDKPMARWRRNTKRIGMEYLRSPVVHHIDVHPLSLQKYSDSAKSRDLYGYYKRPQLDFFNDHSENVLYEINIQKAWKQGKVVSVKRNERWVLTLESGEQIMAENIIVAISVNEQPMIPEWAHKRAFHIFDEQIPDFKKLKPPVVIVGGGITAAHTAVAVSQLFPGKTTLLKRHPFRVHFFDSDPGWLGPKNQTGFRKIEDYQQRREVIKAARHKGSITQELFYKLARFQKRNELQIISGEPIKMNETTITMKDHSNIQAKTVILATGFKSSLPSQPWLQKLILNENLQCAHCGYPIVNESLEWCPHLFVMGPLAELEIGPIARNISGARQAAERIVANL
ncbi:FAD-dependent oxidoreductase [Domibacillus iocasae]|uniref:FAD/NAD(P)-binding domain-containing protein n=1 Tax=Domibacillus iocasae TaxID=1714016 RepID=A0A1E7DUM5_9BACI|nr:FAD-dependent oxidoreductase [Domibacillus iocasae]OES46388.1 hypothetical protein BA724_14210 [Domibacillus iocasae]